MWCAAHSRAGDLPALPGTDLYLWPLPLRPHINGGSTRQDAKKEGDARRALRHARLPDPRS